MYIGMQRWSQSLWKYSDSIAHSSMEFGSSSGSHDERLLRPLLRRKQKTPVRSHSSVWENEARPICDNLKYHPKLSQHPGLGPRSAWRRSVLLWKAWKHSCVMCSRKTSWGVDVHTVTLTLWWWNLLAWGDLEEVAGEREVWACELHVSCGFSQRESSRLSAASESSWTNSAYVTSFKDALQQRRKKNNNNNKNQGWWKHFVFRFTCLGHGGKMLTKRSINWRAASGETSLNPLSPGFPSQLQWKEMRFSAHNVKLVWL